MVLINHSLLDFVFQPAATIFGSLCTFNFLGFIFPVIFSIHIILMFPFFDYGLVQQFRKGRGTRDRIANIRWIIEKARKFQKNIYFCFIDFAKAFECWRRFLRVPWTARRSNQSIIKEISPGCSLEGLMLKLKLQYFGHLMRRVDSLERP